MFYHFYLNHWKKILNIILAILTFFILIYFMKYLVSIALPLFIGLIIFMMTEPFAKYLNRKGIKKVAATSISTMLFIAIIIGIGVTVGIIFTNEVQHLAKTIPKYAQYLKEKMVHLDQTNGYHKRLNAIPNDVVLKGKEYLANAITKVSAYASGFFFGLFSFFTSISKLVVNITIGIIFSFFLSLDIEILKQVFYDKAPKGIQTSALFLKNHVFKGIIGYIKAQLKLISITFLVVIVSLFLITLFITKVNNIFTMSILAAVFDVLPLLGISTLFIPWIIYLFVVGNTTLAIALTVVLAVVVTLRQILEPKIVGESLGVIATVMLGAIIIFMNILGVIGVFISPILIILIRALYQEGYFKKWLTLEKNNEL